MKKVLILSIIPLILGAWLRLPFIGAGLPYFYNEDEAHHFNRVVNMVKTGNFNPEYFHKPSLHFYARMPIVATSFLWNVKEGHLRRLEEIKTKNSFGIAGYAFTASHPGIVKWNRAFSVVLSLLLIVGAVAATTILLPSRSNLFPLAAGLITAVSPSLVAESAVIGVDQLFSLLCLIGTICSVLAWRYQKLLYVSALIAGLAVSAKYNALPIVFIPIAAALFAPKNQIASASIALGVSILGFLGGSPFILAEIPLFLNQFAYEIWHYGIAGHVGHEGTPGLSQAIFYWNWLRHEALFLPALIPAVFGVLISFTKKDRLLFLLFPALFFLLMINQKVNFTRNMTVILPYLAVFTVVGLHWFLGFFKEGFTARLIRWLAIPIFIMLPFSESLIKIAEAVNPVESRNEAVALLHQEKYRTTETAIAGELQLPPSSYSAPHRFSFDQEKTSPLALVQSGAKVVVFKNPPPKEALLYMTSAEQVPGILDPNQRVIRNPSLSFFTVKDDDAALLSLPRQTLSLIESNGVYKTDAAEGRLWSMNRTSELPNLACPSTKGCEATISLFSPWTDQSVKVFIAQAQTPREIVRFQESTRMSVKVLLPPGKSTFTFIASRISSPANLTLSSDSRRLAFAVESVSITPLV